jgi:hypothetical protein
MEIAMLIPRKSPSRLGASEDADGMRNSADYAHPLRETHEKFARA